MFSAETYAKRRAELRRRIGSGLILLPGNDEAPMNYPNNAYNFRQDSTFLYFFGQSLPALAGVIDADSGAETLYGDDFTVEDIIWMGPQPSVADLAAEVGVSQSRPMAALAADLRHALAQGRKVHYLPPYRGETTLQLSQLLGIVPSMVHDRMSLDLLFAVAEMREVKSDEELACIEEAFNIGYHMHTTAMRLCRAGRSEHEIAGAVDGVAMSYGTGVSFATILSQHGEVLHNHDHSGTLESGRLLLCDAGGEHGERIAGAGGDDQQVQQLLGPDGLRSGDGGDDPVVTDTGHLPHQFMGAAEAGQIHSFRFDDGNLFESVGADFCMGMHGSSGNHGSSCSGPQAGLFDFQQQVALSKRVPLESG